MISYFIHTDKLAGCRHHMTETRHKDCYSSRWTSCGQAGLPVAKPLGCSRNEAALLNLANMLLSGRLCRGVCCSWRAEVLPAHPAATASPAGRRRCCSLHPHPSSTVVSSPQEPQSGVNIRGYRYKYSLNEEIMFAGSFCRLYFRS